MVTIQEKAIEQLERISRNLATIGEKEDYTDIAIKALDQEHCEDAVSRKTVLNTLNRMNSVLDENRTVETYKELLTVCYNDLPPVMPVRKKEWIPFTTRPLTEEEKEEHSEWDGILDCKLPDDGQRILVSISVRGHECVQYDEFYMDDGCYLDSGYEIGTEAVAWMPLPEPYKAEMVRMQNG